MSHYHRYEGSYDLEDSSEQRRMYKFYKRARDMIKPPHDNTSQHSASDKEDDDPLPQLDDVIDDIQLPQLDDVLDDLELPELEEIIIDHPAQALPQSPGRSPIALPVAASLSSEMAASSAQNNSGSNLNASLETVSSPIPGTSTENIYVTSYNYSPFKTHLKISNQVVLTRKFTKKNAKRPYAITGNEYFNSEKKKQQEKIEKQQQIEERKRLEKREAGPSKPSGKKTKHRILASDSEEDERITFDDSDDELDLDDDNCCSACLGAENWNEDDAWIGCSNDKCSKWFHKICLTPAVLSMTQEELDKYDFFCDICERRNKKKPRRSLQ